MDRQERIEKTVIDLKGEWPKGNGGGDCLFLREGKYTVGYVDYPWGDFICNKGEFMEAWERKFRKVEQAVIDLNGVLPKVGRIEQRYILDDDGILKKSEPGVHGFSVVCTDSQFMETRKRLENKPGWDKVPGFCNYLAINGADGRWCAFTGKPIKSLTRECWEAAPGGYKLTLVGKGVVFGDWEKSLERRPESKEDQEAKPGSVEWDGQGFPPVGAKVEYWRNRKNLWAPCRISYVGSKYIVFKNETGAEKSRRKSQVTFRPIMSHRDKVIEAAHKVLKGSALMTPAAAIHELSQAGALKLPEEHE